MFYPCSMFTQRAWQLAAETRTKILTHGSKGKEMHKNPQAELGSFG